MSTHTKLTTAIALITLTLASAAYARRAQRDLRTRRQLESGPRVVPGNWGTHYAAHRKYRGVDAYAGTGAGDMKLFPSVGSKSTLSPGSLNYEPDFNR